MAPVAIVRSNRGINGHRAAAAYLFPILHIYSFTFHYCFFYSSVPTSVNIFITPLSRVSALLFIYLYSLHFSSKYTAMCLCILYTIFEQEFYRGTKNFTSNYSSLDSAHFLAFVPLFSFSSIPLTFLDIFLLLLLLTISTNLITILHTSAEPPFPVTTLYTSYFYLLFFLLLFRFFLHFAVVPFWVNFP